MGDSGALPIILAGPILRRVEPTRLCVWIATSRAVSVTGLVYNAAATKQLGEGKNDTIAFGAALHITVVEITPTSKEKSLTSRNAPTFPVRSLLAYDLILEVVGKDGKVLGRQLLSNLTSSGGANALAYAPYSYPTFFMDDSSLNILHGSCRKAHGAGDDALACADTVLQRTASNLTHRPSALFLTGDQIYADDVHDEFIGPVSTFGRYLLGFDEHIPTLSAPVHKLDPRRRLELAATFFSPSPEEAKNQLLGFGDFAGMYLFSLNDELWKDRFTPKSEGLKGFLHALPKVRCALANVATYMIFDDHELTDDWNLSKAWEIRALRGPQGRMGKRVIAHALCAYWAFQGWGNKPEAFDATFRKTITDYFANRESDGSAFEAILLETHPWSFVAPTTPPVFFLDSRTRRAASTVRPDAPSALLNDDALQDFHSQVSMQQASSNWLIVIAQTPVFGNPDSESYLEDKGFREAAAEKYDLEMWHANRAGYYKLLRVLHAIAPHGCIILSGDVHYGFVARASVTVMGATVPFTQFTSSELKNAATGFSKFGLDVIRKKAGAIDEQGWMSAPKYTNPNVSKRIREILTVSPTVVTDAEFLEAGIMAKSETTIRNQPIRPTTPSDGYFLHTQTNIGQLVLTPKGEAILRFYGTRSANPFATYKIQVDSLLLTR